jgi:hypothetical protein
MDARCNNENIRFWPVVLGGDGTPIPQFEFFLNKAFDSTVQIKGLNRPSFKIHFQSRITNALAQCSARLAL